MLPGFGFILMIVCVWAFHGIGEKEYGNGLLSAGLSVLFWFGFRYLFRAGMFGSLAGQAILFACMTGYNMFRDNRRKSTYKKQPPKQDPDI